MGVTESYGDDPCKFAIWTHRSTSEIYILKTETPEDKVKWIKTLKQLLEHLKQFANGKIACKSIEIYRAVLNESYVVYNSMLSLFHAIY